MITVDYDSDYFEIDRLYCTTTSAIVKNLKNHFARHGIEDEVMTDNGPNLVNDEFAKFAESWNILHTTSSPYYSRCNGKAEAAVKIAKTLLRKVKRSKLDFYEALLDWRNTPTEGVNASPSQRVFSRRTKTKLPTTEKLLVPNVSTQVSESITRIRQLAKYYHDKNSKNLPALEQGQTVYMWNQPVEKGTPWDPGTVKHVLKDWSYIVSTDGYDGRRNRIDIRERTCSNGEMMTNSEQNTSTTSDPINSENQSIWRSSRTMKPRKRLIKEC